MIQFKAKAEIRLPHIFADNMVLQQDNCRIWGKAAVGEIVKVTIGRNKQSAVTGADGKWQVFFPFLKSGKKAILTVEGKNKIVLSNILIGDVWLGSGQSNMVWELKLMENANAEIRAASFPEIRLFKVKNIGAAGSLQDDLEGKWEICSPETAGDFSATLYFFGINLYKELHRPLGLIVDAWSGSRIQSWISLNDLRTDRQTSKEVDERLAILDDSQALKKYNLEQLSTWQKDSASAIGRGIKVPGKPLPTLPLNRDRPGGLYNSMISPLLGLSIKGVLWYQGEFNTSDPEQYARLLPILVNSWRKEWKNELLPFVVVQLPNVNQPLAGPSESPWARLREAQLKVLAVKNTAVVITLDTGDGELHPKTKRKLGERAASSALKLAYAKKIPAEAPAYSGYKIEENHIRIFFTNIGGGLYSLDKQPLKGFAISGSNHQFVNASAELDSNSVIVWNTHISVPVAVRYAWAQFPIVNLYSKEGLPAAPFRTDNWPVDLKSLTEDSTRGIILKKLLFPDYNLAPLRDWEKIYNEFQFRIAEKKEQVLPYRFYMPKTEPGKKYPLVVLMHGAGERGFDNRLQLSRLKSLPFWEKYPCFIIAPQCPQRPVADSDAESVWVKTSFGAASHRMMDQPTWPMQMTMDLLNRTIADFPVDTSRVYVTGLSMGGFATWELLQRMPDRFTAAIPVCGGGDTSLASKMVSVALWVFHGDADKTVMPQRSADMVRSIRLAGGNPRFTEYPGIGHNAWTETYNNPAVWDWLFLQKKQRDK